MIVDFHTHIEYKSDGSRYTAAEFVAAMDQRRHRQVGRARRRSERRGDQAGLGRSEHDGRGGRASTTTMWPRSAGSFPTGSSASARSIPTAISPNARSERAVKELGLRGIKIYPHSGFYPNDPRLNCVYRRCAELNVPVVIHTGIKAVRWQWMKYNRPIYVDDVATNFPDLKVVMCHGGFPWVDEFPDRGPFQPEHLGGHQFPGLSGADFPPAGADGRDAAKSGRAGRRRAAALGHGRPLHGPAALRPARPGELRPLSGFPGAAIRFSQRAGQKDAILGGNAVNLLGLS